LSELEGSRRGTEQELARAKALLQKMRQETEPEDSKQSSASELEALRENVGHLERSLVETEKQALTLQHPLELEQAARALEDLEHQFGTRPMAEQARLIRLMVQRVDYDGGEGKLTLTLDPAGVVAAVAEQIQPDEDKDS
jgi:site-specific DNA recombinase